MSLKKRFGAIAKVEDLDDGTIRVWGIASSAAEDADGETITAEAMRDALPDYLRFGAVREMHQPLAAGTALEAEVLPDGQTRFCAHIVDSEAVRKVRAGVYKGFSIGGQVTTRDPANPQVITGLKLVEVSLVDRPANPDAVITCFKARQARPLKKGAFAVARAAELAEALHGFKGYLELLSCNSEAPTVLIGQVGQLTGAMYDALVELTQFEALRVQGLLGAAPEGEDEVDPDAEDEDAADPAPSGKQPPAKAGKQQPPAKPGKTAFAEDEDEDADEEEDAEDDEEAEDHEAEEDDEDAAPARRRGKPAGKASARTGDKPAARKSTRLGGDALRKLNRLAADFELLKGELGRLSQERSRLQKRVRQLEALPEQPRLALRSVEKGEDVRRVPVTDAVRKEDGSVEETATLIKRAFATPMRLL
ncbi:hypothetical protein [Leeia aquatica]|uniref:Phage prohead protease, HK97 family n=1 Tax=Leeia aquatica TaxID=2725557 RepID=A0A847SAW0_9NEIS|nr:hypothetical protein [Leeia aquatica]NLR74218.1 hypothetical protein [Leeia aquatica]